MKKKILWVSEASFMNTGFSVQAMECIQRLHATGKYELAELGSYVNDNDPRGLDLPWQFYGAIPTQEGTLAHKRFYSSNEGQFGAAVFEDVLLDFQPDIVIHPRDPWMNNYELESPYRKYYKSIWIPTIDGEPQKAEWIDEYRTADLLLTHSKYAKELLNRQAPDINVFDMANPGVNHEIFKPMSKATCRQILGLPQNANIVMTMMRNQKRKLFPDLIEMFAQFLDYCAKKDNVELAKNTFLYLHTSYPDVGYDIARHILQNNLSHKVFCTYYCRNCSKFYASHFQTEMTTCKHCGALAAILPNTQYGLTREEVALVHNAADIYIQYAVCEGLGMPLCEAKACGIPVMAPSYSAMTEHCECLGTWKINVQRGFHEDVMGTEQFRSLPDNEDAYKKLYVFFKNHAKNNYSNILRQNAIDNFSFDRSAKVIENAIDSISILNRNMTWLYNEKRFMPMNFRVPDIQNNGDFIDYLITNIMFMPERINTEWRHKLVKGLNVGYINYKNSRIQFTKEAAIEMAKEIVSAHNYWENARINKLGINDRKLEWSLI